MTVSVTKAPAFILISFFFTPVICYNQIMSRSEKEKTAASNKDNTKSSMSLSTRLLIGSLAIIVIPVVLAIIVFGLIDSRYTEHYKKEYGLEAFSSGGAFDNVMIYSIQTADVFDGVRNTANAAPEKFSDKVYLNSVNESLVSENAFLVVRKGESVVYNGSEEYEDAELNTLLPAYGSGERETEGIDVHIKGRLLIRQADFSDGNGEGSVFIVTVLDRFARGVSDWMFIMVLVCIIILAATAIIVTVWIYKGTLTPITSLKKAAQSIRDGDLDFTVNTGHGTREMNELCDVFEEMRKRLKESQNEKLTYDQESRELISNISHDLKTPITAVKGYVEGIMDGVADTPEKMERYIKTIYNKANEMDRLINELSFYSKIDTNRMPYTFTKISAKEFFADCAEELELELNGEKIAFSYRDELPEDETVIADTEQLKRVVHNIVNNSVKYMDKPEKKIELRLKDAGDFIQAEIEDNGKGIAKKDLAAIFDRFYRTDASRNSTRGGSGIGLSIVRKILDDHGGKVWAESEEGIGTTMCFVLRKYQEVRVDVPEEEA